MENEVRTKLTPAQTAALAHFATPNTAETADGERAAVNRTTVRNLCRLGLIREVGRKDWKRAKDGRMMTLPVYVAC